jgi:F0F1-type ATP synthase membrane subunit b/b'
MKKIFLFISIMMMAGLAFANEGGEHGAEELMHIPFVVVYQAINFTILIALLYGLTRKKVKAYFSARLETHEEAKKSALQAFADAQEKHEEVTKKLSSLKSDEAATIQKAQAEAMLLKSKLIQEAEQLAANIVADSKKTAHYEFEKAKQELRKEAFEQALKLAKDNIEKTMTEKDQKNLQTQFVENIGTVQ